MIKSYLFSILLLLSFSFSWGQTEKKECDLIVFSEITIEDPQIILDYDANCDLDYMNIDVFDHWGNHVYGLDENGMSWGNNKIILEPSMKEEGTPELKGSYYYIVKFRFKNKKESFKRSGTIFVEEA